jgi:uncharacterized membrane protein (UPF0127 family)
MAPGARRVLTGGAEGDVMFLENLRTRKTIASDTMLAASRATRRKGLLGRDSLDISSALVIFPCWAVHTIGMRFPIDVIFVDRRGRIVRMVNDLGPWRTAITPRAHAVIELPAGRLRCQDVAVGDELYLVTGGGERSTVVLGEGKQPLPAALVRAVRDTTPEWSGPSSPQ